MAKQRTLKQTDGKLITSDFDVINALNQQFDTDYDGFIVHHDGLHEILFGFYGGVPLDDALVYTVAKSGPHGEVLLDL